MIKLFATSLLLLLIVSCSSVKELSLPEKFDLQKKIFLEDFNTYKKENNLPRSAKIQSVDFNQSEETITFYFNRDLSFIPFREDNVQELTNNFKNSFGEEFSEFTFELVSLNQPIRELIPNFYRSKEELKDKSRLPKNSISDRIPVVKNSSKPFEISNGLNNSNILLWQSHGWYYNVKEKRWMWQRARLFQTVEDLGPLQFTVPYIIPMLENAGASVFIPRERDIQLSEVVVDNDYDKNHSYFETSKDNAHWKTNSNKGFGLSNSTIKEGENPFNNGTGRFIQSSLSETASAFWNPDIPQTGEYAVYVSYNHSNKNISDANYSVLHSGGKTEFKINQTIGGGTWIYLGTFKFEKGKLDHQGVRLTNKSNESGKIVSADAVRFGGGMGIVEREGSTSGRPKFMEGARYWLQYAGMPDTLVYNLNEDLDDYKDDYQSRAEYGNYLYGNPFGPSRKKDVDGLGIPIDISLAFHTDAGITRNDTVIGTLMIYSIPGIDSTVIFPDNVSRFANRDLSDIVQTQIVDDIRLKYDSTWTRRQLMNAMYSEAARPNFPSMLLELISHQNFTDVKFFNDPRYRFDVSRSIYKGMLKFLSQQYGYEYVVQPLLVTHFAAILKNDGSVSLTWQPQVDPIESTAAPNKYIIYTREGSAGFDNGVLSNTNEMKIPNIKPGVIYSYKVIAVNDGGESFPSEILSVCRIENNPEPLLIINGFDRVSGPAWIETEEFSGFLNFLDEGVPDKYDLGFTGTQFNFDPASKWETDDNPGHGASHSDYETSIIAGNTFDYSFVHGKAIMQNGFSFCSTSDESVEDGYVDLDDYKFVDLILGEEKKTSAPKYSNEIQYEAFSGALRGKIKRYFDTGGKMLITGAYIGTDLYSLDDDSSCKKFANEVLKISLETGHAVKKGNVFSVNNSFMNLNDTFEFNTAFTDSIYKVEAPDEIGAINGSEILLRYAENNFSAGIGFIGNYGVVSFAFPFETIIGEKSRVGVMKSALKYLDVK